MPEQLTAPLTGRYTVERAIGAGGMATVYLARDVKHNRRVALKVLNPELGAVLGAERFLSEIEVTANLQHPNLLPLFDSGEAGGLLFYVMPFVDGESLRARLDREKQLSVDEAIHIATALASALAYAHAQGVIHRDLKPENILLQAGEPVIADFGIALAVSKAGGARVTQTGISLGTPQYMSPEQATGDRVIDRRADIYSLGVVLYEMLAGDPPYLGGTAQAVIAKVLTERPKGVRSSRASVPVHVEATIERALEKLPADRFATAHEFAEALQGRAVASPIREDAARSYSAGNVWKRRSVAGALIAVGVLVPAAWELGRRNGGVEPDVVRLVLDTPPDAPLANAFLGATLAISPDARTVTYASQSLSGAQVAVRRLDELQARLIPTTGGRYPTFSGDGKWVVFSEAVGLKRVATEGGPVSSISNKVTIFAGPGLTGAPNGSFVVSGETTNLTGLTVAGPGDSTRVLTRPDSATGQLFHRYPVVLADDKTVLFASYGIEGSPEARIAVTSLGGGPATILPVKGIAPLGVIDGYLIFVQAGGTVMGVRFDVAARRTTGEPVALEDGVRTHGNGSVEAAMARNGTLVYVRGSATSRHILVDHQGVARPLFADVRQFVSPRFSPNGRSISVNRGDETNEIWVYDVASRSPTRLTIEGGQNDRAEWFPDGKRILFRSTRAGRALYWSQSADGTDKATKLFEFPAVPQAVMAPDGKTVIFRGQGSATGMDLLRVSLGDTAAAVRIAASPFNESMPTVSRDGRWLAYISSDAGVLDVFAQPLSGPAVRTPVSVGGGTEPRWSPDGTRIYYRANRKIIAANVRTTPALTVTSRDTLFEDRYIQDPFHANWDIAPDGRRFVMLEPVDNDQQMVVVLNFARVVREKVRAPMQTP